MNTTHAYARTHARPALAKYKRDGHDESELTPGVYCVLIGLIEASYIAVINFFFFSDIVAFVMA